MIDPMKRRQFGIAALGLGALFMSVAVLAAGGNTVRRDAAVEALRLNDQQCDDKLRLLGAKSVSRTADRVVVKWPSMEDGYAALGSASAAAMACPGWKMHSFCMGQTCATPGIELELARVSG